MLFIPVLYVTIGGDTYCTFLDIVTKTDSINDMIENNPKFKKEYEHLVKGYPKARNKEDEGFCYVFYPIKDALSLNTFISVEHMTKNSYWTIEDIVIDEYPSIFTYEIVPDGNQFKLRRKSKMLNFQVNGLFDVEIYCQPY